MIDRVELVRILNERIMDKEVVRLVAKLLAPMKIELADGKSFFQYKGVP